MDENGWNYFADFSKDIPASLMVATVKPGLSLLPLRLPWYLLGPWFNISALEVSDGFCYLSWNFHFNSFQRSALHGSKSRETAELINFLIFMIAIQKGFKPDSSILVSQSPNLLPICPPEQEGGSNRHQSPRMRLPKIQWIFPILRGLHPIWFIYIYIFISSILYR